MILKFFNLFFLFFSIGLLSQEQPPIQNYSPVDYGAGNQNWSFSQSDDKYIYTANNNGLLEFNGSNWKFYPALNETPITSVKAIEELIYTGSYMEFGYWKRDGFGNLKYTSILNKLQVPLIEDEQFWNISQFRDWVLFQSLDRIYIYHSVNESFDILDAKSTKAEIFKVGNSIYFQKINEGVFTIENGKSVLVSDNSVLRNDIVVGVFSINKNTLVVTEQGEFYFMDSNGLSRWEISADAELSATKVYSSLQLNDGSFILGTISNGIYHLDKRGNIIRNINQGKGLNNNTVLGAFQDFDHNLWLGLDNGISVINLDSPFNEYIDEVGRLGVVYTSIQVDDFIYLGTNQGLFFKEKSSENDFSMIKNTAGQVWLLKKIDGTLFCGHNSGTFVVVEDEASRIANFPGTWDIKPIEAKHDLLLQGNFKGLSVLEKVAGQWRFRNRIEGFDNASRFFEFVDRHHILVNHEYKGIFDLKIDSGFHKVLEVRKEISKGRGSSLVEYGNNIFYSTNNGVFKYSKIEQEFIKDAILTRRLFNDEDKIIGVLTLDQKKGRLWGFTNKNIVYIAPGKFNNDPQVTKIPVPDFFIKSLGKSGFENITHIREELYLIGLSNGYITLDLEKLKNKEYTINLNSISKEFHETPKIEVKLNGGNEFKFSENNLNFFFSVPEFDKYTEVNFQYQLNGIYDEWSSWSTAPNTSFKNLPFGDYTFKVRAKAGNTLSKNVASYKFTIDRPRYLSNLAILLYLVSVILISALIHRFYKAYYKRQQYLLLKESEKKLVRKKLKIEKRLAQIKNEQLQELLENKNRELAISTMSIIKKNEFLNAIKDQLMESAENPQIKSVIRTIDRNITNEDDWKFFEDAFNNADKDFLKKVKNVHPELTANDLRLCAYLRLNLSSKEIAPLLNISVRSVEVKRYRLRKKMNLPHEDGLTEYIMEM